MFFYFDLLVKRGVTLFYGAMARRRCGGVHSSFHWVLDFQDASTVALLEGNPIEVFSGNDIETRQSREVFVNRLRVQIPQAGSTYFFGEEMIVQPLPAIGKCPF